MKTKYFLTLALVVLVLAVGVMVSSANADGIITLTGGTLSVKPQVIDFGEHRLTGYNETYPGVTTPWEISDPTGSGIGWRLYVKATDFTKDADITKRISVEGFRISLADDAIAVVEGNQKPVATLTSLTALSYTDQLLAVAEPGTGMGTYNTLPTFSLGVPADTYAGIYHAQLTCTLTSGPN